MSPLRALARVNVAAIERNVVRLRRELRPGSELCAVVKADGYGHGALAAARAALAGGATWLAVATANEATALRGAGVEGPLLVLGALSPEELDAALSAGADVVAWREASSTRWPHAAAGAYTSSSTPGWGAWARATPRRRRGSRRRPPRARRAARRRHDALRHRRRARRRLLRRAARALRGLGATLRERHPGLILHAANSAGLLRDGESHFDLVRAGVAIYGLDPFQEDAGARELEPAMELASYVAEVKPCAAGQRGLRPALRGRGRHRARHRADRYGAG